MMKGIFEKSTANTIFNGERLKTSLLRSGTRKRVLFSPLLFNIVLGVIASTIRQEKEIKIIYIEKEKNKIISIY